MFVVLDSSVEYIRLFYLQSRTRWHGLAGPPENAKPTVLLSFGLRSASQVTFQARWGRICSMADCVCKITEFTEVQKHFYLEGNTDAIKTTEDAAKSKGNIIFLTRR